VSADAGVASMLGEPARRKVLGLIGLGARGRLLVVGADDQITPPACLIRAAEIIPEARLLIVPQTGHMTPLETPDVFNAAVLEFLREAEVDH
jgi:pimeloyl-ACP methyl ester carboxylesterase